MMLNFIRTSGAITLQEWSRDLGNVILWDNSYRTTDKVSLNYALSFLQFILDHIIFYTKNVNIIGTMAIDHNVLIVELSPSFSDV